MNASFRIGQRVVYDAGGPNHEHGEVTGISEQYVQVRYDGDQHSKATRREDLEAIT